MVKSIIVAKAENDVIGVKNRLPWRMPADLKYFKKTTMGHHLVMGRKTFESMGKLAGRTSIIITRNRGYKADGCIVVHSIEEAFKAAEAAGQKEVFILGGEKIFEQTLNTADKIYLTEIKARFKGDTLFPKIDYAKWQEIGREEFEADEKNPHPYAFVKLVRKE